MSVVKQVFISHSSTDEAVAQQLCRGLEAGGVSCWIAPRDIPVTKKYPEVITQAIASARVLLLVFSERVLTSETVFSEVELCFSQRLPIVVYRLDATDPRKTNFALFLRTYVWFDAGMNGDVEGSLPKLIDGLRTHLAEGGETIGVRREDGGRTDGREQKRSRERRRVVPAAQRVIGIDLGSSNIRGCVRDAAGIDVQTADEPYLEDITRPSTARSVLEQTQRMLARILEAEHFGRQMPAGIGIAVPGQADVRAGTLKFSPGLAVRNVPFRTRLATAYPGVNIRIDNDARCATRCELHLGTGRQYNSFVCIFVGTGLGSGIALNRRIHFGENFCAGEIGHMKVDTSGPPCTCGQIGCLEAFVNAPAMAARAHAKAIDFRSRGLPTLLSEEKSLDPRAVVGALEAGDPAAREVIDEMGEKLGTGIANYLNVVNPGAVVLGGGLMAGFYLHMIDSITRAVQKTAVAEVSNTPIVQSQFTNDAAAIGAALLFHPDDPWPG